MDDRVSEYFEINDQVKVIKADLKDYLDNHPHKDEIDKHKKQIKEMQEEMNNDETIDAMKEKIKSLKERQDLIKEILLVEMKESGNDRIEYKGNEIIIAESLKFQKIKKK